MIVRIRLVNKESDDDVVDDGYGDDKDGHDSVDHDDRDGEDTLPASLALSASR